MDIRTLMTTHDVSSQDVLELNILRIPVDPWSDESVRLLESVERVVS